MVLESVSMDDGCGASGKALRGSVTYRWAGETVKDFLAPKKAQKMQKADPRLTGASLGVWRVQNNSRALGVRRGPCSSQQIRLKSQCPKPTGSFTTQWWPTCCGVAEDLRFSHGGDTCISHYSGHSLEGFKGGREAEIKLFICTVSFVAIKSISTG